MAHHQYSVRRPAERLVDVWHVSGEADEVAWPQLHRVSGGTGPQPSTSDDQGLGDPGRMGVGASGPGGEGDLVDLGEAMPEYAVQQPRGDGTGDLRALAGPHHLHP